MAKYRAKYVSHCEDEAVIEAASFKEATEKALKRLADYAYDPDTKFIGYELESIALESGDWERVS